MNAKRNWTYLAVTAIVRCYMLGALAISFNHIITAANMLELHGWQAYTVPFAVDGFAVLGMIGRCRRFAESTQRTGLRLQVLAGALSLAANVYAGATIGERMYGALVVTAFVVAEWYAGKLAPAEVRNTEPAVVEVVREVVVEVPAPAPVADPAEAKRQQRRERDRFNRAVKAGVDKRLASTQLDAMLDGYVPANAPVSPATMAPAGEPAAYL